MKQMLEPTIQEVIANEIIVHDRKPEILQKIVFYLEPINKRIVKECNFFMEIEPGSQVAYKFNGFWHHGIYVGNKQMIHMSGTTKEKATIRIDSVETFMENANGRCIVIEYENDNEEARQLTCEYAKFFLEAHGSTEGLYNIVSFNCEHFATFCRTSKWRYVINNVVQQICLETVFNLNPYFLGPFKWKK